MRVLAFPVCIVQESITDLLQVRIDISSLSSARVSYVHGPCCRGCSKKIIIETQNITLSPKTWTNDESTFCYRQVSKPFISVRNKCMLDPCET